MRHYFAVLLVTFRPLDWTPKSVQSRIWKTTRRFVVILSRTWYQIPRTDNWEGRGRFILRPHHPRPMTEISSVKSKNGQVKNIAVQRDVLGVMEAKSINPLTSKRRSSIHRHRYLSPSRQPMGHLEENREKQVDGNPSDSAIILHAWSVKYRLHPWCNCSDQGNVQCSRNI